MEILFVILIIFGGFITFVGLVATFDGEFLGILPLVGGAIFLWIGIAGIHNHNHKVYVHRHAAIYKDLRAEHWKIKYDDVSGSHRNVSFDCLTLDVDNLDGKWQVTVPRPESKGGGSTILNSSKERLLRKVC